MRTASLPGDWRPAREEASGGPLDAEEFAHYIRAREQTFVDWPHAFPRVEDLIRAGFEYAGYDDAVRCVYCSIRIQDWEANKHPLFVHRDKAIGCPLMNDIHNCLCSEHIFVNRYYNYELRRIIRRAMPSARQGTILRTGNESEEANTIGESECVRSDMRGIVPTIDVVGKGPYSLRQPRRRAPLAALHAAPVI